VEIIKTEGFSSEKIGDAAKTHDHIFLDTKLADWRSLGARKQDRLTLVKKEALPWNTPEARSLTLGTLTKHPCLLLEDLSATDLVRLLHLYLLPKRLAGATPLLEKGAIVIGEKIQGTETLGTTMDKLAAYLEQTDGLSLKGRIFDLRQVLTAVLAEAYQRARSVIATYPAVDFQVAASGQKIVVNLRFPAAGLTMEELPRQILNGEELFWQQAWLCSDTTRWRSPSCSTAACAPR
jgi:hypothetical protein